MYEKIGFISCGWMSITESNNCVTVIFSMKKKQPRKCSMPYTQRNAYANGFDGNYHVPILWYIVDIKWFLFSTWIIKHIVFIWFYVRSFYFFLLINSFSIWSCSLHFGCTTQIALFVSHTHTRTRKKKNAKRLHLMAEFTVEFSFVSFYVMISVFFFSTLGWATILLQMVLKLNNVVFVLHFRVVVFILFHFIILSVFVS